MQHRESAPNMRGSETIEKHQFAEHANCPSTVASAEHPTDVALVRSIVTSMSSRSPGITGRRNLALSMPAR